MSESLPEVILNTDGACSGNPGPGEWGSGWMEYPEEMNEFKLKIAGNYV
tara:strand:+ start:56690 stop:56836 length:147 start_codon:yes stop_codon:yes gene_type:complete